jgi:hypothetical protein
MHQIQIFVRREVTVPLLILAYAVTPSTKEQTVKFLNALEDGEMTAK